MNNVTHAVASDLVREYLHVDKLAKQPAPSVLCYHPDYFIGWKDAIRATAVRMGVYPLFNDLLESETKR
jgi:hypothetical protein